MWTSLLLIFFLCLFFKNWGTTIENIPGPKFALPLLGHLSIISKEPHKTFLEWKKTYGFMFSVQLGQLRAVVLNDMKLIKEAFTMHETTGRPPQDVFERVCDKKGIGFSSGPAVFEQRKFFLKSVRKFCYEDRSHFESKIQDEISAVLAKFGENTNQPCRMKHTFNIPVLNAAWNFFMGGNVDSSDPQVKCLAKCATDLATIDGIVANLAFFVPVVAKLFPNFAGIEKMYKGGVAFYDFVDQEWKKGCPSRISGQPRNYKEAWMDKIESAPTDSSFHPSREKNAPFPVIIEMNFISENYFRATMGDILLASMETTAATIDWAVIYLARNPESQKKLQEELDTVVGATGHVALEVRRELPYMEAVIHEVLRISSVGPLGLLHYTTEEWHFKGFTIPAKTCVIGNLYAVHDDPEIWENPNEFRPERFLDESNNLINTQMIIPFSTGKRNCLGESIARDLLFLFIANIFYKFEVLCTEKLPRLTPVHGVTSTPKPYEVMFRRRQN